MNDEIEIDHELFIKHIGQLPSHRIKKFRPHRGQIRAFKELEGKRFCLLHTPNRWGKTLSGAIWGAERTALPRRMGCIVVPVLELGERAFRYVIEVLSSHNIHPVDYRMKPHMVAEYPQGSIIRVKTAKNLMTIEAEPWDWAWMDEVGYLNRTVLDYVMARLMDRQGELLATGTKKIYWLYKIAKSQDWGISTGHSLLDTNHITATEIKAMRKQMSPDAYKESVLGEIITRLGLVYHMFDSEKHIIEPFGIPEHWLLEGAVDYGMVNPSVRLVIATSPKGEHYVIKEFYKPRYLQDQFAEMMVNEDKHITTYYVDPSAETVIGCLKRAGKRVIAEKTLDEQKIEAIGQLLANDKLFIFSTCEMTINEFENYCYLESGRPQDVDNHSLDALGYWAVNRRSAVSGGVRIKARRQRLREILR